MFMFGLFRHFPSLLICCLSRETLNRVQQWNLKEYLSRPPCGSSQERGDDDDDDSTDILDGNENTSDQPTCKPTFSLHVRITRIYSMLVIHNETGSNIEIIFMIAN